MKTAILAFLFSSAGAWATPIITHSTYSLDVREAVRGFFTLNEGKTTYAASADGKCALSIVDDTKGQTVQFELSKDGVKRQYSVAAIVDREESAPQYNDHDDTMDTFVTDFDWNENAFWIRDAISYVPRSRSDEQPEFSADSILKNRTPSGRQASRVDFVSPPGRPGLHFLGI